MYFLYQKKILTKLNFKPILQFGSNNRVLTIQLFSPNYLNSLNSIRNPENEQIRILNTWIPLFISNYSNNRIVRTIWPNSDMFLKVCQCSSSFFRAFSKRIFCPYKSVFSMSAKSEIGVILTKCMSLMGAFPITLPTIKTIKYSGILRWKTQRGQNAQITIKLLPNGSYKPSNIIGWSETTGWSQFCAWIILPASGNGIPNSILIPSPISRSLTIELPMRNVIGLFVLYCSPF